MPCRRAFETRQRTGGKAVKQLCEGCSLVGADSWELPLPGWTIKSFRLYPGTYFTCRYCPECSRRNAADRAARRLAELNGTAPR